MKIKKRIKIKPEYTVFDDLFFWLSLADTSDLTFGLFEKNKNSKGETGKEIMPITTQREQNV
jgi:hypothetical protein